MPDLPGRSCPLHYRYAPTVFATPAAVTCEVLYVVGGVYGNPLALDAVFAAFAAEAGPKHLLFNGDFNWFNIDPEQFQRLNAQVLCWPATRGNVETELGATGGDAGCGCAYPTWVDDGTVARSNAIMQRLRQTAAQFPALQERLTALPMWQRIDVGATRVAVVHGDAASLAGWGFAQEALREPSHLAQVRHWFAQAQVDVFASSHTCLPIIQQLEVQGAPKVIANNGAAGLPNFVGTQYGVLTRIATRPYEGSLRCGGVHTGGLYIDALALHYAQAAWEQCFLAQWPAGSDAHTSYWARLQHGPAYTVGEAVPPRPEQEDAWRRTLIRMISRNVRR
jgi:hypothetical protein